MSLPPRYLAKKLTEALPTKDGKNRRVLRTISDARDYMLTLGEGHRAEAMATATSRGTKQTPPGVATRTGGGLPGRSATG